MVSEIILNRFKNLFDPNSKFDKKIVPLFNIKVTGKKEIKNQGDKLVVVTRSSGVDNPVSRRTKSLILVG